MSFPSSRESKIGAVAQLGERCVRNAEVEGSIPFGSSLRCSALAELCRMTYVAKLSK
jgi:hypothetical protein